MEPQRGGKPSRALRVVAEAVSSGIFRYQSRRPRLNAEMVRILRLPEIKEKLAHEGLQPVGNTPEESTIYPEEFTIYIRNETAKWSKAVQITGVKAN